MTDSTGVDPASGTGLAGYRLERVLGRGGTSVVFLAEDLALGRRVALKVLALELSGDRRFHERFRLESRLAASIDHPNVIPIYEAGDAEGRLYIAMRYVEGTDLRRLIADEGGLEPVRAVELVARVADALEAAHARGLVHRDIKPSNVLIADPGEGEHVYLADFGLTRTAADTDGGEAAPLAGTTDYIAPEVVSGGGAGRAADVYSLGCVLYEALTGSPPYPRRSEFETLWAHVEEPPPRPSGLRDELPAALDAVVTTAMAKDPGERYASAAEFADAVRATLPSSRRSRGLTLAFGLATLVLAAALATILLVRSDPTAADTSPSTELSSGALQVVDSESGQLEATIRLERSAPFALAVRGGAVWLADAEENVLYRIDPETRMGERFETFPTPSVRGLAAMSGASDELWVGAIGQDGQALLMPARPGEASEEHWVDLRTLALKSQEPPAPVQLLAQIVPDRAPGAAFAGWVLDGAEGTIRRLEGGSPPILSPPIETGGVPLVATARDGELWVGQDGQLVRIVGERRVARTRLSGRPVALVAGDAGIWAAVSDGTVALVGRDGDIMRELRTDGEPVDLALGEDSLWVLQRIGRLDRLDVSTGKTLSSEWIGANPVAVALGEGAVWVAVRGGRRFERSRIPARLRTTGDFGITVPEGCRIAPGDDCRLSFGLALRTPDGVRGIYIGSWWERRAQGGTVVCGGKRYHGPAISDVRADAGSGLIVLDGWGTLALRYERMIVVGEGVSGPPLCGEGTGTWLATAGPLRGERGEFTFTGPIDESITLR